MTLLNYIHYTAIIIIMFIFIGGVYTTLKQPNKKLIFPMLISITLINLFLIVLSILVIDKYTKIPKLYKLKSKRLLNIEKVAYTGTVKNEGKFKIGQVIVEIKLVNKGMALGNVKAGSFFKSSGFGDFFGGGSNVLYKPQSITKEFVVAKNLKPGEAKAFRVYFGWPPYFKQVAEFTEVYGR